MATRTPARVGDRIPLTGGLIVTTRYTAADQARHRTDGDRKGLTEPFRDPLASFFLYAQNDLRSGSCRLRGAVDTLHCVALTCPTSASIASPRITGSCEFQIAQPGVVR